MFEPRRSFFYSLKSPQGCFWSYTHSRSRRSALHFCRSTVPSDKATTAADFLRLGSNRFHDHTQVLRNWARSFLARELTTLSVSSTSWRNISLSRGRFSNASDLYISTMQKFVELSSQVYGNRT